MTFEPRDPAFDARVRGNFARQQFMVTIGAALTRVEPGAVDIEAAFSADLTQQHGFFHAGVTSSIADSAAGYASYSLFPVGFGVLTAEFKISLLNPATGPALRAAGRVIKPGRLLCIARSDVYGGEGFGTHVATGLFTLIAREGLD